MHKGAVRARKTSKVWTWKQDLLLLSVQFSSKLQPLCKKWTKALHKHLIYRVMHKNPLWLLHIKVTNLSKICFKDNFMTWKWNKADRGKRFTQEEVGGIHSRRIICMVVFPRQSNAFWQVIIINMTGWIKSWVYITDMESVTWIDGQIEIPLEICIMKHIKVLYHLQRLNDTWTSENSELHCIL